MEIKDVVHPWHTSIGSKAPEIVNAIIEISKESQMKYELDKETGLLKLDRVLFSSVHYPMNYGLIPQTYFEDDDPMDILVICTMNIQPLCILEARPIGLMHMEDENGIDDKIISVANSDPSLAEINSIDDLAPHTIEELKNFFQYYKILEGKKVKVGELKGRQPAIDCIKKAMEMYTQKFGS
jgi:inorganic pyrophosphatase